MEKIKGLKKSCGNYSYNNLSGSVVNLSNLSYYSTIVIIVTTVTTIVIKDIKVIITH